MISSETITATDYHSGDGIRIQTRGNLIAEVSTVPDRAVNDIIVAPGLTDIQVNGYGGTDLNTWPLAPSAVRDVSVLLWRDGVTTWFPTFITNSDENLSEMVRAVDEACRRYPEAGSSVGGIHLEGPFITTEDGARGAHPLRYVRPPDWNMFCKWQEASGGRIKIVTMSPEWPDSNSFIEKCVSSGVTVSIGHTSATPEMIAEAVKAGASLSTHLGNASHQMLPRHRNYIWEQLASPELFISIITDGFHLPDSVMKVFLKVKQGKTVLISDSTQFTGMKPGEYKTHIGGDVVLTDDGKLHIKGFPDVLAGSGKSLLHCVQTLVSRKLSTLAEALDMAGMAPYRLTGLPGECQLAPGGVADMVLIKVERGALKIVRTIKAGETVFRDE